ncbi:MAG: OmpA family protein [Bacteroidota bacterium]|nr:OmpA family protein [Bacteroidota bacterium]
MRTYFKLLILLCFMSLGTIAQNYNKLSTKSEKAKKLYFEASQYFDKRNNAECIEYLNKAIKADPDFIEAYMLMGDAFIDSRNINKGIEAYQNAIRISPDFFPPIYLNLGNIQFFQGNYEDAYNYYKKFLSYERQNVSSVKKAIRNMDNCEFAMWAIKHPVPFNPVNLGDSINTKYDEYLPALTADGKTLIITRREPKDPKFENNVSRWSEDFFISHLVNGSWTKTVNLGPPINTEYNEGAQCISPDGQYLFYTGCDRPEGYGSCDIYYSRRIGKNWSKPINMGRNFNSPNWDSQPSISSDGKTIYFVSSRSGGKGGMDIWTSTLQDDGSWGIPENLGDVINTDKDEMSPYIHPDNQTLYFCSKGHKGMGGFDLFYTRRDENGKWGVPVNLGYPINTNNDESSLIVSADGKTAYFASDKLKGKGRIDIYSFDLYEEARPQSLTYMNGIVFDKYSGKRLEAHFELIDLKIGKTVIESSSNPGDGSFLVCLPANKNYALNVSKDGYLFYSENFSLKGIKDIKEPYKKDIALQPIVVGSTVILKNIFFETASYQLKDESITELEKLVDFMTKNSKLKIEISGHTDNVGDDKSNQLLSENRAKAVVDFLISKNISSNRLSPKGYGKTKPVDTNDTSDGRANNRRTEFKIIEN